MRKFLKAAVAASLLTVGAAQAGVITFDGLADSPTAPNAPFFGVGDFFFQSGYYLEPFSNQSGAQVGDLVGAIIDGSDVANTCSSVVCPTNNSTNFFAGVNDGVLYVAADAAPSFSVRRFDASFIGGGGNVIPNTSLILRMQGTKVGGGTLTGSFNLSGLNANNELNFQSFQTTGAFSTQQFTEMYIFGLACNTAGSCSAFSSDQGQFALDNIDLRAPGEVPEPASLALTGLALLAALGVRRRRQSV